MRDAAGLAGNADIPLALRMASSSEVLPWSTPLTSRAFQFGGPRGVVDDVGELDGSDSAS